jgi:hypothetical protein
MRSPSFDTRHMLEGAHSASYSTDSGGWVRGGELPPEIKQAEPEANNAPPSSIEISNAWSRSFPPPLKYVVLAR